MVGWDGLGWLRVGWEGLWLVGKVRGWLGWFRWVKGRSGRFMVNWDGLGWSRLGWEGCRQPKLEGEVLLIN